MKTLPPVPMTYGEWKALLLASGQKPVCSQAIIPDNEPGQFMEVQFEEGDQRVPGYSGVTGFWFMDAVPQDTKPYMPREEYDLPGLPIGSYVKDRKNMKTDAPKVTLEEVEAAIKGETYTVLPDGRTTICQLTLDNDFTVDGHSACVSVENFNAELGNKYSREEAVKKVWAFLGFRLADRLSLVRNAVGQGKLGEDTIYVGTKAVKALPMNRGEYNDYRGWNHPNDENVTDEGYLVEYLDGGASNHPKHKGYISWSPKDVFERSYKKVS